MQLTFVIVVSLSIRALFLFATNLSLWGPTETGTRCSQKTKGGRQILLIACLLDKVDASSRVLEFSGSDAGMQGPLETGSGRQAGLGDDLATTCLGVGFCVPGCPASHFLPVFQPRVF